MVCREQENDSAHVTDKLYTFKYNLLLLFFKIILGTFFNFRGRKLKIVLICSKGYKLKDLEPQDKQEAKFTVILNLSA